MSENKESLDETAIYEVVEGYLQRLLEEIAEMDDFGARARSQTLGSECAATLKRQFGPDAIKIANRLTYPSQDVPSGFWFNLR